MADATRPDAPFIAALEAANLHPLWDRYKAITPVEPRAADAPFLWRWRDVEPYAMRAAEECSLEDAERRAIILAHPAFGGATQTTSNLLAAFTILEPGDKARPHRHTAAAIRFSSQAEGAVTIVNGRRCEMREGDLILTPPMCWHGHINESNRRTVWFDAANMPLICGLDANFFEPGDARAADFWTGDAGGEELWSEAGLAAGAAPDAAGHSPKYRYPGAAVRRLLAAAPPAADGARVVRYVNPATGGPVMATLDCSAVRLGDRAATRQRRASWNRICLVVSGQGRSRIGEQTVEWSKHDVFTIPHWTWASHQALGGEADLFVVSDRAALERLHLARDEMR
ncbi:MAG TPA: cupin domain-containing protein [Stellaceae bacterium]|nr:cupin domain-containing protein [Stellaceae bacterium]